MIISFSKSATLGIIIGNFPKIKLKHFQAKNVSNGEQRVVTLVHFL